VSVPLVMPRGKFQLVARAGRRRVGCARQCFSLWTPLHPSTRSSPPVNPPRSICPAIDRPRSPRRVVVPLKPANASRHAVRRRLVPPHPHLLRLLPQQTTYGPFRIENVPSQHLQQRRAMSRHPAKQVVTNIRRRGGSDKCAESAERPESREVSMERR